MSQPSTARVLRVSISVDGHVVDEIHQWSVTAMSAGSDYRNELLVFGPDVPRRAALFEVRGGQYLLNVPASASGRIQVGRKTIALKKLRARASRPQFQVGLSPKVSGSIELGDAVITFGFVPPAEAPRRPASTPEYDQPVLEWFNRGDVTAFLIAVATLGTVFGYAALSEYEPSEPSLDRVDERFIVAMGLKPKPEEPVPEEPEEPEDELKQEDEDKPEEKKPEPKETPKEPPKEQPKQFSEKAMQQARGVGIARTLGTYGGEGPGTVLDVMEATENRLGEMFAAGMTRVVDADGTDVSDFVPGGSGISAKGATAENAGLGVDGGPEVEGAAAGKAEKKIKGTAKVSGKTDIFGDVDQNAIKATLRRRISALQACYERALQTQPNLSGKMTFTVTIGVMGNVTAVSIDEDTVGAPSMVECTKTRIRGWRFPVQGAEEPAEVTFPVVFSGSN